MKTGLLVSGQWSVAGESVVGGLFFYFSSVLLQDILLQLIYRYDAKWALWWISVKSYILLDFFHKKKGLFCTIMMDYCEMEGFWKVSCYLRYIIFRVTFMIGASEREQASENHVTLGMITLTQCELQNCPFHITDQSHTSLTEQN